MDNASFVFGIFNSKSEFNTPLVFSLVFQTPSEMTIKGIRVTYAELMNLLSMFKGTVGMN